MKSSAFGVFVALLLLPAGAIDAADVVVVCPPQWRGVMKPWGELRREQHLTIQWVAPAATAVKTRRQILEVADSSTRYVVLVGDMPVFGQPAAASHVPTFYRTAQITVAHGSTPTIPSDLPYADFDGDELVDAAIGRLPVQTEAQLRRLVDRIIGYERSTDFGLWRRCLQLTGGVGGFGDLVDDAIESVTRGVLTSILPIDAKPQIAYASPGHPFCPDGRPFPDAVWDRYERGSRFWVYAGHGSVDRLDILERADDDGEKLQTPPRGGRPVEKDASDESEGRWKVSALLDSQSAGRLRCQPSRAPIGVLLACYAGATDARVDCLAERMVLADGGPVALIAASRVSMPYGNAKFGLGLLDAVYNKRVSRLGDATRAAIRPLQQSEGAPTPVQVGAIGWMIDGLAAMISPAGADLAAERSEHASLYQLLGDPLLSLHPPKPLSLSVKAADLLPADHDAKPLVDSVESANALRALRVEVSAPFEGKLWLSVDRPLGEVSGNTVAPESTADETPTASGVRNILRDEADPHRLTLVAEQYPITSEVPLVAKLMVPPGWSGPIVVRAFVEGNAGWATAATQTRLP